MYSRSRKPATPSCQFAYQQAKYFDQTCIVFALDDFASLAILSSSIHSTWVMRYTLDDADRYQVLAV